MVGKWSTSLTIARPSEDEMPVITAPEAPTHTLGGTTFTSLATPSRGSSRTSVWEVSVSPGETPTPHRLTDEEVFVVLDGVAAVTLGDQRQQATAGDAIVVPAGVDFSLANAGDTRLRLLCCLPVGGQAVLADGEPFTPPWAQ
jgi:mannose-6-phosphate isomerase-like protein (cupin superfamily)